MDQKTAAILDRENPTAHSFKLISWQAGFVYITAIIFSAFQVITAAFNPVSSQVLRSLHVGFLLLLVFLLFDVKGQPRKGPIPLYDWALSAISFALAFYHWFFEADLIQRAGNPNTIDLLVGSMVVILVVDAARRIMGWGLPLFCIAFIPYAMFGRWLPGFLQHRGFGFDQVIDQMFLGTEGIYGIATFVSATFIFLFILFGAFLERAGMIQLFNDVAMGTVGHHKGGPAKVAVVSSALMGTINGSGVANVLTVGQFTIPLMIKFGYRPAFAGAVEATASMGGQIMPPVMGAVAFIMAETIGVPYADVAIAAVIPAILYFGSAFWMVHLEADRRGLVGLPKAQCPSALSAIKKKWHLALPLVALVWLLFDGFTPLFAGTIGLALTAMLILGNRLVAERPLLWRIIFWVSLALVIAGLRQTFGWRLETLAIGMTGVLILVALLFRPGRDTIKLLLDSMAEAARGALSVGIACALVGILIGVTTLTGLASDIARVILMVAGDNLFLALFMTMIACLVLGTGLPTIPNYIITSAMAAPVLLKMGVPLIVSHMFVFYFGIMADLTPPVALAALAASSISRAGHMEIGWIATKLGVAGYVVPFMAVYSPVLMLQGGTWVDTTYVLAKALLAVALWGGAASAWLGGKLSWMERLWATAAAFLLVIAITWTDAAGFILATLFIFWRWWQIRQSTGQAA